MIAVRRSRTRDALLRVLLVAAALAVQISTLPDAVWLAAMLGVIAGIRLERHSDTACLLHVGGEYWHLQRNGHCVSGRLHREGYLSPWLQVIVLETRNAQRIRLSLWRDSVDARAFSWLAWQRRLANRQVDRQGKSGP